MLLCSTGAGAPKLLTWPDLTSRPRPQPDLTVSYGQDIMQKVDVWLPDGRTGGATPHPTVLMVHGGCWQTSIADRSLMNWIADDLRRSGFAVWNIDYRGVDRAGGGYPGTFLDAARATEVLQTYAKRLNLDTRRIVAVGHSAGGHLALWLAGRHRVPQGSPIHTVRPLSVAHVVSLGGLPDLEATAVSPDNGCGTKVVTRLVGERADRYVDTSPARLSPLRVPHDLVNGREDRIIPLRLATTYAWQARQAGDRVGLHVVPGTGHVELIAPESAAWAKAKQLIASAYGSRIVTRP